MVTVDQLCNSVLMAEMAASGCLAVAVGVESVDDDNCASVSKYQNLQQPYADAVRQANELGIQTAALIMIGLPHDTPERLALTMQKLKQIPCSLYDIRILRIYPSTALYGEMLATGEVNENWWLEKESPSTCNHLLPSCLSMHFKHGNFNAMQLQHMALKLTAELNPMNPGSISHILRIGNRGNGIKFAWTVLYARQQAARQTRKLLKQVEQAMAANPGVSRAADSYLQNPSEFVRRSNRTGH